MNLFKKDTSANRSEQLRQKRQPASQTHPEDPAASTPISSSAPYRVVTRRSENQAANRQSAGTPPRRKVVYAVSANGVETRLPALPIFHFSWQWVSGILTVLLLIFAIILINSPLFRINAFELYGLTRYSSADFEPLLINHQTSVFTVNTEEILDTILMTYPELMGSEVSVKLPNRIVITASEREPVVLWHSDGGDYWIDGEGVVLAPRGEVSGLFTINSPVSPPLLVERKAPTNVNEYLTMVFEQIEKPLNPSDRAAHVNTGVMQVALAMSSHLPEGAVLVYDPISGIGWQDQGGWEVFFGTDLSQIETKLVIYQAILNHLNSLGLNPVFISIAYIDAPFYRTE
ncbi:MAG: hypothetical protein KBD67_05720 [Anaerolineaceae bacterium]|nr:hypothetical protein [Anaerolineaceae bacterium]